MFFRYQKRNAGGQRDLAGTAPLPARILSRELIGLFIKAKL
jgi:hypothetical protein